MRRRRITLLLLMVILAMLFSVPVHAKIKLNKKSVTVTVGKTVRLKVKGTKKKVKWRSTNKKIARVSSKGVVKGVKEGKCKIIAKVGKKQLKCTVTVKKAKNYISTSSSSSLKNSSLNYSNLTAYNLDVYVPNPGAACKRTIKDGWYMIVSGNSDDRALDINAGKGGNLETFTRNNSINQRFYVRFTKTGGLFSNKGYYTFLTQDSAKYLQLENSTNKYSNVHEWSGNSSDSAKWTITNAVGDYYYITNKANKSCLDNTGGSTALGNNVATCPQNGTKAQRWMFLPTSGSGAAISGGTYEIQSANSSSYVLDIQGAGKKDGDNLIIYTRHKQTNQQFYLLYNNGYFTIKAVHSGKYLQVANPSLKYSNVYQWTGNLSSNAQWVISDAGGGYYYIQNKANGCYLENANGKVRLSNNVRTYPFTGAKSQKWKFNKKEDSSNSGTLRLTLDPDSTLSISSYTTPSSINEGSGFTCKGTISSNYVIKEVTVGIYNANGTVISNKTVYPNAKSYDIKNIDSYIHFSQAKAGTCYYKVSARDEKISKELINKSFTVKKVESSSSIILDMTVTDYDSKVNSFLADDRWKPGIWYGASQGPKLSTWGSSGCCAYAADFVKYVFGKNGPRTGTPFYNPSEIRSGDVIYVSGSGETPDHWFVVLYRNGNALTTVEGNWSSIVVKSSTAYSVSGNTLLRDGSKFRTFNTGYHYR